MTSDAETVEPDYFNVYSLTSALPAYQQCRIFLQGSFFPSIYSRAFGPALRKECEAWVAQHCTGGQAIDEESSDLVTGTGSTLEDAILDANGKFETGGADIEVKSQIVDFGATSGGFAGQVSYWVTARKAS